MFNLKVIWDKFQVQFQYTDCAHPTQTQLLGASSTRFFGTLNGRLADNLDVLLRSCTSGSARSPFVNIMNSSLVFKLLYSPPYGFSVWCGFNREMTLILSLGFHNCFGLKVKFHHFSLLLNCKRHLNRISLRFCEIKFFTYTLKSEKEKTILIGCCNITVK